MILFFSMLSDEGKSLLVGNIARKLKSQGKKVRVISFSGKELLEKQMAMAEEEVGTYIEHLNTPLLNGHKSSLPVKQRAHDFETDEPERSNLSLNIPENDQNSEELMIFQVDESYYSIKSYNEIFQRNATDKDNSADYILIELPPVLSFPYPTELVASADLAIMVCRSTRVWSEADQGALSTLMKLTHRTPLFLLNGVDLNVVKSSIGRLPKTRTNRKKMRRGFFSRLGRQAKTTTR